MFTTLMGGLTSLISKWFDNKAKLSDAKAAYRIKELDSITDYDTQAQRNMSSTWKDEYLVLLHTFPIWGYIIPSERLTSQLDILWGKLDGAPDWWWSIYIGIVVSTFGLRFMFNKMRLPK